MFEKTRNVARNTKDLTGKGLNNMKDSLISLATDNPIGDLIGSTFKGAKYMLKDNSSNNNRDEKPNTKPNTKPKNKDNQVQNTDSSSKVVNTGNIKNASSAEQIEEVVQDIKTKRAYNKTGKYKANTHSISSISSISSTPLVSSNHNSSVELQKINEKLDNIDDALQEIKKPKKKEQDTAIDFKDRESGLGTVDASSMNDSASISKDKEQSSNIFDMFGSNNDHKSSKASKGSSFKSLGKGVKKGARGLMKGLGKGASRAMPLAGAALMAYDVYNASKEYKLKNNDFDRKEVIAETGGGLAGAISGAKIGFMMAAPLPIPGARLVGTAVGASAGYVLGDKVGEKLNEMFAKPFDKIPDDQKESPFVMYDYINNALLPNMKQQLSVETDPDRAEDLQGEIKSLESSAPELISTDNVKDYLEEELKRVKGNDWDNATKTKYLNSLSASLGNENYTSLTNSVISEEYAPKTGLSKVSQNISDFVFGKKTDAQNKESIYNAKALTSFNAKQGTNLGSDSSDNLDTLEEKGILEQNLLGNSIIKDWDSIEQLPSQIIDQLIQDDDWDDNTMKRLKSLKVKIKKHNSAPSINTNEEASQKITSKAIMPKGIEQLKSISPSVQVPKVQEKKEQKEQPIIINSNQQEQKQPQVGLNNFGDNDSLLLTLAIDGR